MIRSFKPVLITLLFAMVCVSAWADELEDEIVRLQHAWAYGQYQLAESQRDGYFESLRAQAEAVTKRFSGRAEPLIWEGIITATLAKYQSLFKAGSTAKAARDALLAAERIDPEALEGSALVSLGSLYYKVPRFGSFGDYDKARSYLQRALKINPDGIDANFFYGEFLYETGQTEQAIIHLKKALAAPPRPGREDADAGRREEIRALLKKIGIQG